ncbi:Putative FBD-associated F-box protein At1g61330 [Linum perenne]
MATTGDRGSNKKEVDYISALTHEVLVEILSLLTFKEAARTSVLSKRWVDRWKWIPNLEFEYGAMVDRSLVGKNTYIQLVSKVLAQHKGPKVNKFRVCLQLTGTSNSGGDIERWVEFAISKGVERLELDFNPEFAEMEFDRYYEEFGGYPVHPKLKCFYHSRVLLGLSNVQYFRALRLRYVHLTEVMVHHLVSSCHLLEKLVLERCDGLVKVKATALPSSSALLPLKHLEILRCPYVKEIEINAPNLVSFCYDGCKVDIQMENVSGLKEMNLRIRDFSNYIEVGIRYVSPYDLLRQHQSKFVQLETLTFEMDFSTIDESEEPMYDDPYTESDDGPWEELQTSIKVLELTGFDTYSTDPFLDYVLHHFVMLEKLIINHRKSHESPSPYYYDEEEPSDAEKAEAAIALCISHWRSLFPTVEFVVL